MYATLKVENIIFGNRDNAERVLREMRHIANEYGCVSVADLYDLTDRNAVYTDNRYIWLPHSLNNVYVHKVPNGYTFYLPTAILRSSEKTAVAYSARKTSPKPLTITLDYAGIDEGNFDEVLAKVFQYAQTITDREVQIDIC